MDAVRSPERSPRHARARKAAPWSDPCLWQLRPQADPRAPTVLLLPHAGGGGQSFDRLAASLPGGARLLAAQYPGRGPRYGEPLADDLADLVSPLVDATARLAGPLVMLGHSLGAIVGFELAWSLERRGRPVHGLVASAALAPHAGDLTAGYADVLRSDDALVAMLRANGGLPAELLASPEMCALVVDVVRADLRLLQRYDFGTEARVLDCPIAPIGGDDDPLTPTRSLLRWNELSAAPRPARILPGGHFYLFDHPLAVAEAVLALLVSRPDTAEGHDRSTPRSRP